MANSRIVVVLVSVFVFVGVSLRICCIGSYVFFFLMIRRPPRSTQSRSSAASDVYKRQDLTNSAGEFIKFVKVDINVPQRQCIVGTDVQAYDCLLYTSPSPRDS